MAKLNFQHHYSSLQCHMILKKIALAIFRLIIKLNTLYIFVETETLLFLNQDSLINRKFEEQHLFETENFCNILDVFICHLCSI